MQSCHGGNGMVLTEKTECKAYHPVMVLIHPYRPLDLDKEFLLFPDTNATQHKTTKVKSYGWLE